MWVKDLIISQMEVQNCVATGLAFGNVNEWSEVRNNKVDTVFPDGRISDCMD